MDMELGASLILLRIHVGFLPERGANGPKR